MTAADWDKYVNADPRIKTLMVSKAPRWEMTLGQDILSVCQIANQRAHGEVGDQILLSREWFTDEQIWVIGCILTKELYMWRAEPGLEGFSDAEQMKLLKN